MMHRHETDSEDAVLIFRRIRGIRCPVRLIIRQTVH